MRDSREKKETFSYTYISVCTGNEDKGGWRKLRMYPLEGVCGGEGPVALRIRWLFLFMRKPPWKETWRGLYQRIQPPTLHPYQRGVICRPCHGGGSRKASPDSCSNMSGFSQVEFSRAVLTSRTNFLNPESFTSNIIPSPFPLPPPTPLH